MHSIHFHRCSDAHESLQSDATHRPAAVHRNPVTFPPRPRRSPPTMEQQPIFLRHLRKFFRSNAVRHEQAPDPLDFPATSALPNRSLAQATPHLDNFETVSPPRRSNELMRSLRQQFSLHRSRPTHGSPAVEVAAGRKFTRLAAANLPEYRKVNDTRHPSKPAESQDNQPSESSDIDSLPDVHWCKAFFCYYSVLDPWQAENASAMALGAR
ncbi:hypothetical protein DFH29DRAFT_502602 [Suillus ampliporus]|nr:hypothetical protein DFH29DRAFT_502602 [Suillus ampliporus]